MPPSFSTPPVNTPLDGRAARLPVHVAPVQAEQLLGPQAGADGDDRDRPVARVELGGDGLYVLPGVERQHVAAFVPLPLRVPVPDRRVTRREVPCDRPRRAPV